MSISCQFYSPSYDRTAGVMDITEGPQDYFAQDLSHYMDECEVIILCNTSLDDIHTVLPLMPTNISDRVEREWDSYDITDFFSIDTEIEAPLRFMHDVLMCKVGAYEKEEMFKVCVGVWMELRRTPRRNGVLPLSGSAYDPGLIETEPMDELGDWSMEPTTDHIRACIRGEESDADDSTMSESPIHGNNPYYGADGSEIDDSTMSESPIHGNNPYYGADGSEIDDSSSSQSPVEWNDPYFDLHVDPHRGTDNSGIQEPPLSWNDNDLQHWLSSIQDDTHVPAS
jgi:hypothetical protein